MDPGDAEATAPVRDQGKTFAVAEAAGGILGISDRELAEESDAMSEPGVGENRGAVDAALGDGELAEQIERIPDTRAVVLDVLMFEFESGEEAVAPFGVPAKDQRAHQ